MASFADGFDRLYALRPHEIQLGILKRLRGTPMSATALSLDDVIEKRAYFQFYMHRTGHWLGMDVHDCGGYLELSELGKTSERKDALTCETIINRPRAHPACRHGADHRARQLRAPRAGRAGEVSQHRHPH